MCNILKPESLTKEQQDNVVTRILRGYDKIHEIKFLEFSKSTKTGYYSLVIEINGDSSKRTRYSTVNYESFNKQSGLLGLDPIENFQELKRDKELDPDEAVSLENIRIHYLGE